MEQTLENGLRIDGKRLQKRKNKSNIDFGRVNLYDADGNLIGYGYLNNVLTDVDYDVKLTEEKFNQFVDLWNSTSESSFTVEFDKIPWFKFRIRALWWRFVSKIHKIFKR